MEGTPTTTSRMPAAFIGHGSPMNAIEINRYTRAWRALGASVPRPRRRIPERSWQFATLRPASVYYLFVEGGSKDPPWPLNWLMYS